MNLSDYINNKGKPRLAVLIDPDKFNPLLVDLAEQSKVSFFLVGGSSLRKNNLTKTILAIKKRSSKPVFIFPGDETQISNKADGMLLLSLISGRNPEYLIGKHVKAAPLIKKHKIKTLSTGYILVDGKKKSSTQKISRTKALSGRDVKTIVNTAIAGQLLGLQAIYLEAGSGARKEINPGIIKAVKKNCSLPLLVGGGIDSSRKAKIAMDSGADVVVVGNALEKNIYLVSEIEKALL